jgi:hypothetical protein
LVDLRKAPPSFLKCPFECTVKFVMLWCGGGLSEHTLSLRSCSHTSSFLKKGNGKETSQYILGQKVEIILYNNWVIMQNIFHSASKVFEKHISREIHTSGH